ncbi:MAG TPA: MFS transporter, partial [Gaiellaceae bacterium]
MSSSTPARLFRLVCGGEIERSLRGILAVTLISTTAFAALWSYVGIWGVTHLHASQSAVGVMYVLDAIGAALSGYFGGRLSDRLGRRLVIAAAWGTEALAALALAGVGHRILLGFALVILAGTASGPGFAATNAIVADLVPETERESAYAAMRVATNLGFVTGPPLGGLLLIGT